MQPKRIEPGERIPIRLSDRDRNLILNCTFVGGDLERRIRIATADGSGVVVNLTLDDLDELLGFVAAEANHSKDPRMAKQLYKLHERLQQIEGSYTDEPIDHHPAPPTPSGQARYTPKQGQYLAFIHYYTKIHGIPPAESEMQRYFRVSAPAVHQMICTLERSGLIERVPGRARTIRVLVPRGELPDLE
jgi:DNA-binding MarR family transcriptional regulator